MRVLVVGGGAREHAIIWKLKQSPNVTDIICAPGNAGIAQLATCVDLQVTDIEKLADLAVVQGADLTIASDRASIYAGIVDYFQARRLKIFGPDLEATALSRSRYLAKEFMLKHKIPTARYAMFEREDLARAYVSSRQPPIVIKTDDTTVDTSASIAIASSHEEALAYLKEVFAGSNTQRVIVEDFVVGLETSLQLVCDGTRNVAMVPFHTQWRLQNEDTGAVTAGMGAFAPCPRINERMLANAVTRVIDPLMKSMTASKMVFTGALDLTIIFETEASPKLVAIGPTLSDLGAQVLLPLLDEDLFEIFWAVTEKNLAHFRLSGFKFHPSTCLAVALTSQASAEEMQANLEIDGLPRVENSQQMHIEKQVVEHARPVAIDVCPYVFHEGTELLSEDLPNRYKAASNRVLTLAVVADNLLDAKVAAYELCKNVRFESMHYRRDIGDQSLA